MKRTSTSLLFAATGLGLAAPFTLSAQQAGASSPHVLDDVVVSATRLRSVADLDVPASVTTIAVDHDANGRQVEVSELLSGVPGVTALDRRNYAQDTQLSIRGFGSRATFGVRGLRLYADGIPASMPDGQGQLSHFSVLGADRLQVMRGPFSALHGNSSGGVVQIWSSPGTEETSGRVRATYGSYDTRTLGAQLLGQAGPLDYNLSASRFQTDGYRDHASARRDSVNLRLGVDLAPGQTLAVVGNYVNIPDADDPLGVKPENWRANPRGTAPQALEFNTRKSVEQVQAGVVYEHRLGAHTLRAQVYSGNRQVVQYLAIPAATQQVFETHSGGVIDLDGDYDGADLRWSWAGSLAGRSVEVTAGANYDYQDQLRRGYENFVGSNLGVRGNLRRDETNRIRNFDQFAQGYLQLTGRWSVLAGLRHSEVRFRSIDRYINGANGDDSGTRKYSDTTLVGGVMFRPVNSLRLYASVGDGFETPTFNEISYRADGGAGLAFDLNAARSHNYELGLKWRPAGGIELDAALFRADTDDELVVVLNTGGRSSYANVDRTRRQGVEASLVLPLAAHWQVEGSYTLLDAEFRSDYLTCTGTCTTPGVTVPAGSRIPGIPRHQGSLALRWSPGAWQAAVLFEARSKVVVNDVGTFQAPGFGVWHAEVGHSWTLPGSTLRGFARVENLLDKTYVGSVIVNEGNQRFFEAAPERNAMVGLQWSWR